MLRLEVGFDAGSGVFKLCQAQKFSRLSFKSIDPGELTFAWSEEVIGERKSDQAAQGQDEEGKELSLNANKAALLASPSAMPYNVNASPAHHRCSLTTSCGGFRATAVAAA